MFQTIVMSKEEEQALADKWLLDNPQAVEELGAQSLYANIEQDLGPIQTSIPEYTARPYGNKFLDALQYAEELHNAFDAYPSTRLKGIAHSIRKVIDEAKNYEVDRWYVKQWVLHLGLYKINIPLNDMLEIKEGAIFHNEAPQSGATNADVAAKTHSPAVEQAEWERDKLVPKLHKYEEDVHPEFLRDCKDLITQLGYSSPSMSCALPQITFALLIENIELIKAANISNEVRVDIDEEQDEPTGLGYSKLDIAISKRFWAFRRLDSRDGGLNMFFKVFGLEKKYTEKYPESADKGLQFLKGRLESSIEFASGKSNPYS